jgi:bifunctional non-homologous end joining protein LigD
MHVASETTARKLAREVPVVFLAFDLLWLDGHSTLDVPYEDRRALLEKLELNGPSWQTPGWYRDGKALRAATSEAGLEGILAKRLDSPYRPGVRNREWLKIKNHLAQEFVIGGWMPGQGNREGFLGALLLGYHDEAEEGSPLRYAGRVGTGFTGKELERMKRLLTPLVRDTSPFTGAPRLKDPVWVEPELVAQVRFTEWTSGGIVRHPAYLGLRDDKPATDVVRET